MTTSPRDRIYRTEGIILSRLDQGETNRIFAVFTPRHGKIRVIAKGVRKPQSRMAPHLEYFCHCNLMLARGRDLDVVTGAETIDPFMAIRTNLDAYGSAAYIAELVNRLTEDGEDQPRLYDLLVRTLTLLAGGVDVYMPLRHFELGLLTVLGFRPELYECVACRTAIQAQSNALSGELGGMLCPACRSGDLTAPVLSVNAQKVIRMLDRQGLAAAASLSIDADVRGEVERALSLYLRHLLDRDLSSPRVVRDMRDGLGPSYSAGG